MRRQLRALMAALIGVALVTVGFAVPSQADEWDDKRAQNQARQDAVNKALDELSAELEETGQALIDAYAELQGIQAQIPVAEAQLKEAEDTLATLQREAAIIAQRLETATTLESEITTKIETDTQRADDLRAAIGRMARDAYKGDMTTSAMSAVLDSSSTDEFVQQSELASVALRTQTQALREVEQIVGVNRNREARLVAVREQITELKKEADQNVADAEVARQKAEARKADLVALEKEAKAKAAEIESQKASLQDQQAELEKQQAQLEADLKKIVAAQEEARRKAGQTPIGSTASQPFINPSSVNPIYKTSDYGMRFHPILHYWRMHAGVDLRTWCNTPVYAAAAGTVEWAQYRAGYGNQVMLNNGYWNGKSLMSSYNHLSSFAVSAGQKVSQGQLIAYAGNTGTSAACHLHFEVYINGATTDPWPLIAK
ncbi:peptidoglycan DD-metalloendopeptidase family protein [Actinotalea sp. M2MS4P-6]|uniref:M23 family metallopeptidase n=1 Tax=Actinotalea sp. M2MS4P-6 TaxID=2983762 RepID=UPI0021E50B35|nr:M23 family metallopeptidase [Actinotalea sp. M2MS4P-6]MCV2393730.1 peptidoglycan DD-metalloendopeptidase family protein [Actinotalea sp. M2MS4P-6]